MGRKVVVKRPDGSSIVVDEGDAKSLETLGYKVESTEEAASRMAAAADKEYFTGLGNKALTFAEGVASGASLGLTDVGGMSTETRLSAQYNPTQRLVGEIGGALLTTIPSGGTSLEAAGGRLAARELIAATPAGVVARGGKAIEGAIGGTKGAIAGGAFEGTVAGMGSAITQAAINDDPLTVESVLTAGGIGGVFGGGVGGIAERLGKVAPKFIGKADDAEAVLQRTGYTADDLDSFYSGLPKEKVPKVGKAWEGVDAPSPYETVNVAEDVTESTFVPNDSFNRIKPNLKTSLDDIDTAAKDLDAKFQEMKYAKNDFTSDIDSAHVKAINDAKIPKLTEEDRLFSSSLRSGDVDSIESSFNSYVKAIEDHTGAPVNRVEVDDAISKYRDYASRHADLQKVGVSTFKEVEREASTLLEKVNGVKGIKKAELKFDAREVRVALKSRDVDAFDEAFSNYITRVEKQLGSPLSPANKEAILKPLKKYRDILSTSDTLLSDVDTAFNSIKSKSSGIVSDYKNAGKLQSKFANDLQMPYKKLQKAISAGDIEQVDTLFKEYSEILSKGATIDTTKIASNIEKYKLASEKAKELIRYKEAASILRDFPDTIDGFRKLKAAKAEKMFAALDTIEKVTGEVALNLDGVLADIGLEAGGSAGQKARTIWESNKSPGFFKNQQKQANKSRIRFDEETVPSNVSKEDIGVNVPKNDPVNQPNENFAEDLIGKMNPEKQGIPVGDFTSGLDFNPDMINTGAQAVNDYVSAGGRKKPINGFWKRAAESAGRRVSSSAARKLGLGALGSAVAFEAGGSATDMLLMGMFGSTVAGNREGAVSRIRGAARKAAPKVGKALEVGRGQFGRLTTRLDGTEDKKADVKARIEEINNAAPIARDKAFKVVEDLVTDHPAFVKSFIDTTDNFIRTLQSFLPKDPGLAFSGGKSLWEPDPVQKVQTAKVLEVAHNPLGTAEYIASGNADMFVVKVFKALWPAQYDEFVVATLETIAPRIQDMSYEEQNYYATVTGVPLHSSFTPRSMAQTQAVYAASAEKERSNKAQMGGTNGNSGRPAKVEPPTSGQSLLT